MTPRRRSTARASTKPTLFSHAVIANGLGTLVNERATIIHTYRVNTLDLISAASAALKETSTETTDLVPGWRVVRGIGMALSIHPEEAYAADVAGFRAALNAVPSTFPELYDLTGNSPTGTH
ncbi:hypothetical protein [Actinophytocola algeriensis]|uniref:Uncharacterized protein n=1 Tax=Actinophytocola algeriensis TaxID=1768010 RepID=A0A7W7PZK4_9PSEU|nr:hypothetical protein [Actinophytocola algeriensis]MBB4904113.1 hypothetical protein [Actinophytocola algeriensis]MBE1477030.1 hypothetical protein [Actinophytocola algeriensis]